MFGLKRFGWKNCNARKIHFKRGQKTIITKRLKTIADRTKFQSFCLLLINLKQNHIFQLFQFLPTDGNKERHWCDFNKTFHKFEEYITKRSSEASFFCWSGKEKLIICTMLLIDLNEVALH